MSNCRRTAWDKYGDWLLEVVGTNMHKKGRLDMMFDSLHYTDFRWVMPRDKNRAYDGISLRDECPIDLSEYDGRPCSVLEMLVRLAIRAEGEIMGDPRDEHPEVLFDAMIKNLGLNRLVDGSFSLWKYDQIIDTWLDRKFDRDGRRSPFPIRKDDRDQRKFEIWDQVNHYIYENYYSSVAR